MKKKILIGIIFTLMLCIVGISFAFFSYVNTSEKTEVVTGQIYMHYNETKNIFLTNAFPETKEMALSRKNDDSAILEFTIDGLNTSARDIIYEIKILEGAGINNRTNRIDPKHVMIYLEADGNVLIDGVSYNDWENRRIYVDTIPGGTTEKLVKKYTLRMWIDEDVTISDTDLNADYTTTLWNDSYASLLVSVTGNFEEKTLSNNNLVKKGDYFWPNQIYNQRNNITNVNFVNLSQSEIDTRFENANIKEIVSENSEDNTVKAWLESNPNNSSKYIMYVGSDGLTYFPENSSYMFMYFENLKGISFANVNTKNVKNMYAMFYYCYNLTSVDFSTFDTSSVTNMSMMFMHCRALSSLDLTAFTTGNVTDMSYMFWSCNNLLELILPNFSTGQVKTMEGMFANIVYLKELDLSSFTTPNVESFAAMFYGCESLTSLDISGFTFNEIVMSSSEKYSELFSSLSANSVVLVGSEKEQNWILVTASQEIRPAGWNTNNVVVKQV